MKPLRPIYRMWFTAYYRWALANLTATNPTSPDLPWIVMRLHALENAQ